MWVRTLVPSLVRRPIRWRSSQKRPVLIQFLKNVRVSRIAISTRRAVGDSIVWLSAGAHRYRIAWAGDVKLGGLGRTAELVEEVGVVLPDRHLVRMVRRQGLLKDCDCALIQRLGLGVTPLATVELGQVVEADGHVRLLGAEDLLPYLQGTW